MTDSTLPPLRYRRFVSGVSKAGLRFIGCAVAGVVVALAVVLTGPSLVGWRLVLLEAGDVAAALPNGTAVLVRPRAADLVAVNDLVLLRAVGSEGPVIHRVTEIERVPNLTTAKTHSDGPDPSAGQWKVLSGDTPIPVRTLPVVGHAVRVASSPAGWLAVVVVPCSGLLSAFLVYLWSRPHSM